MATEIALPANFGAVSSVFAGTAASNDELGQGVSSSYGVMGYKGKVWSTRYQGQETALMREDGDGPRNSIEVVLVKASPAVSKIFYKAGYVEGSNSAPDCWSADGVKPDGSVQAKVHATCADCPMNKFGSARQGDGKACQNTRRVALVPNGPEDTAEDITDATIAYLKVPATGVKHFSGVISRLGKVTRRAMWGVYTNLSSEQAQGKSYYLPTFEVGEKIPDKLMESVFKRVTEAEEEITFGYQPLSDEDRAKAKAPAKKRKYS